MAALLVLATDPSPGPYLAAIVAGFAVGGFGHVIKANLLIAGGILLILIATILFINATDPSLGG